MVFEKRPFDENILTRLLIDSDHQREGQGGMMTCIREIELVGSGRDQDVVDDASGDA